jgi:hypothetical protein
MVRIYFLDTTNVLLPWQFSNHQIGQYPNLNQEIPSKLRVDLRLEDPQRS